MTIGGKFSPILTRSDRSGSRGPSSGVPGAMGRAGSTISRSPGGHRRVTAPTVIGGVVGSTIAAAGGSAVQWKGLFSKVIIPAGLSPIIAALVAATGTWLIYRISRNISDGARKHGFRYGQIGSASLVSLFTLPTAALAGAGAYALAHVIGGLAGVIVDVVLLIAIASVIFIQSRKTAVSANNVNDDWTGGVAPIEPEPAAVA
ncbi:MAG TPA: hypothetical protein VG268_13465 [Streptosporangiaceae bacterium]|nr:hypothetical protein [Streptosporangiaceae bacterium]